MGNYSDIASHRAMVFDEVRNAAYARALRQIIEPGFVVLDLGAGLGIHGLLAAKYGARKVYLVDTSPVVRQASEIARFNKLADRIEVIHGRIEDIELPEQVDAIISVFTGNFLLTEDLLPSLFSARDRFLRPGGMMLPDAARMKVALASADSFSEKHIGCWSRSTSGIEYEPIRRFAANGIYYGSADDIAAVLLTKPATLHELDFCSAETADCRRQTEIMACKDGVCNGVLGWFDMRLGDEWISTGPGEKPMHWSLAFLPIDPPLDLFEGDTVDFELNRPEFGDWTWTVSHGQEQRRHSTFQYNLADMGHLKKQSTAYVPGLGIDGELALYVLKEMAAGKSVAEIMDGVCRWFPRLVERDRALQQRVRNMIVRWSSDEKPSIT